MDQEDEEFNELSSINNYKMELRWKPPIEPLKIMVKPPSKPSFEEAPKLELKSLHKHLKYAYLGLSETLPVIISADLDPMQEEELLTILKENKEALGWTMADLKEISPSIVQHRIHLLEEAKPKRDPQRRLNPAMKEVMKKKIIKLLDNGIIYPILNNSWMSPVQVVPKKSRVTIV